MNIFEYKDFKDDIETYLSEVIGKFGLKYNLNLNDNSTPMENYAFFENENCIICLNNIERFPYPDIIFHFYYRTNQNKILGINDSLVRRFIGIDELKFHTYVLDYDKKQKSSDEFKDISKGAYLSGLKLTNDLLVNFYTPLLDGKLTYSDYHNFIKNDISI